MKLRNIKLSSLIVDLMIGCAYPLYRVISADTEKLMQAINALFISGGAFLLIGIIASLALHGDFDITEYTFKRALFPKNLKPYRDFKSDKEESRKGSFNYPLLIGVLLEVVAVILTLIYNSNIKI